MSSIYVFKDRHISFKRAVLTNFPLTPLEVYEFCRYACFLQLPKKELDKLAYSKELLVGKDQIISFCLEILDLDERFVKMNTEQIQNHKEHLWMMIRKGQYFFWTASKTPISKIRRNDICPCGSSKKYKECCY